MSTTYQFRLDRPLPEEAARVFNGAVRQARRCLKHPDDDRVHKARKAIKRARALLRLVRFALPPTNYRALDAELRDLGRLLSPIRDTAVLGLVLERMGAVGTLTGSDLKRLRDVIDDHARRAWAAFEADGGAAAVRDRLAVCRLAPDDLAGLDDLAIRAGLEATYECGLTRRTRAEAAYQAEYLHAWRRQVKHLGYHVRLLAPAWPHLLGPTARAFDALGEALGDDHDLAEWARVTAEADVPRRMNAHVQRLAEEHRARLRPTITLLGARLYAESAPAFAARMAVYLGTGLAATRGGGAPASERSRQAEPLALTPS